MLEALGVVFLVIIAMIVVVAACVLAVSAGSIRRYLRIRNM